MSKPIQVTELKPGLFFSPGFYMSYWNNSVLKTHPIEVVLKSTKLQKHREMWIGAILAAMNTYASTKVTGSRIEHFVGLPPDEPSDVDVVRLLDVETKNGKTGTKLERLNVQITECSLARGETLIGQVLKKNKPAYEGIVVAVYVTGGTGMRVAEFQAVHDALLQQEKVFSSEIISIHDVNNVGGLFLPRRSYGLSRLYPKPGSTLVDPTDSSAFFRYPEAFQTLGRGIANEWTDLGQIKLLVPDV